MRTIALAFVVSGAVVIGFNFLRFGSFRNELYLNPIFLVPDLGTQLRNAAGLWLSPSGGLLTFWPSFGALLGVAVRAGVIAGVLRGLFHGVLGAGAAYYLSFVLPKRLLHGAMAQVWGLLGAAVGIVIGSADRAGVLGGLALGAGALALAGRRTVAASPESTEELSAHGYLPFVAGLSIAAILLGFTGGFERVREIFAGIAPGLGL
jgi:hypothetical protein